MNKLIDWISVMAQSTGWLFIYCFQVGLEMEWWPLGVKKKKKKKQRIQRVTWRKDHNKQQS